jgi:2-methylcitrate dehydratase PrpD
MVDGRRGVTGLADGRSVAEALAAGVAGLDAGRLPLEVRETCERLLIDIVGLCGAARATDYVTAARAAWPDAGPATIIGFPDTRSAAGAAFVNGTAAHGEDFDDTFEGGPVHSGAVVVPAVLAACEQFGRSGSDALLGIATGVEALCRLSLVAPKKIHALEANRQFQRESSRRLPGWGGTTRSPAVSAKAPSNRPKPRRNRVAG